MNKRQTLSIQEALDLAVQHHNSGELSKAEEIYQEILKEDSNQHVAWHLLGVVAHQRHRNSEAIDLIANAISIKPDYAEAHSNLGLVLKELGRPDEAISHFHQAIELNSKFAEAYSNLGISLKDLGTLEEAALNFRKALSIRPDFPQAVKSLRAVMRQLRHSVKSETTGGSSCGGQQAKEQEKPGRRFFKISERDFSSIVFDIQELETYVQHIKRAKWTKFSWKGLTLMKDPMTMTIYLQLIQELKPKSILEFGTFDGGSALWMSDMIKSLGLNCDIHTFDINSERVKLPRLENVTFHELDNFKIRKFSQSNSEFLSSLEHPILAIEDSHNNVMELLICIDDYLRPGDYLIIEDTLDHSKYEIMRDFLRSHDYEVDTHYCDFWGPNNSWNINSILQKIKKTL